MVVTTVYQPTPAEVRQAKEIAGFLEIPYYERGRRSLPELRRRCQADSVVVAAAAGPRIHTEQGELFFHIGMAALRIKNLRDGKPDHMTAAMQLEQGVTVLDCTLGMGSDAIVASMLTGREGVVTGLETVPAIAFITGWGLANASADIPEITAAMRRIRVVAADYRHYLPSLPDQCVDVVYFDPMFCRPVQGSSGIRALREFADSSRLQPADLQEACRVAKKRVIVKQLQGSGECSRLGISTLIGGRYSRIQYGVMEREAFRWKK
ncbi:MAG: class I SAM-dependent methyltransferase [Sporomusaceae bacterium]|nr:class I SAM-dependent methyltransferase [Sporomusaceae bacterium]